MKIWIIDDDQYWADTHSRKLSESHLQADIKCFNSLLDAYNCHGDADFIFIDLSAVDGRTLPCFNNDAYLDNLRRFVEKHSSSFIVITSALMSHAEEDVDDLRLCCPDAILFAIDVLGTKNSSALSDFVDKYTS